MRWMLLLMAVGFTACSPGGGVGGGSGASVAVCPAAGDFPENGKVQLARNENPNPNQEFMLMSPESLDADLSQTPSLVKAQTRLTAVVRNTCRFPGEITSRLDLDEHASGRPGVRSYPFFVPEDIPRVELEEMAERDECLAGLSDSTVDFVSSLPSDPLVKAQGHLDMLDAAEAYPLFYDAKLGKRRAVVIAVIDTGVDRKHSDLKENLWINPNEIEGNGKDDDENGYVDDINGWNFASSSNNPGPEGTWHGNFHGTHVAGLAAARGYNKTGITGVMGAGARIMSLNVFGADPGAYNYHTENAIRYAADNGADVINLSIGGSSATASYKAALQYAVSKGVTVVAAAGNERRELGPDYFLTPGAYGPSIDGMITVGSVDSTDKAWSRFSNFSPSVVEIAAPGSQDSETYTGLLSTMPNNTYSRLQGTSMATPVAAGAAGLAIQLLRALGYGASPVRIEAALKASGLRMNDLTTKVQDGKVLNLKSLADYVTTKYPRLAVPEPEAASKTGSGEGMPIVPCS